MFRSILFSVSLSGVFLCGLLGSMVLGSSPCLADGDGYLEVDKVIASVDGDPFTLYELKKKITPAMARMKSAPKAGQQAKLLQIGMQEMMIEKVLIKEAEASNIKVGEKEISAYITEIKRQNGVDDAGFQSILRNRGMTLDQYKKDVRIDILRGRVIGKQINKKEIAVSEAEIDNFIDKEIDNLPEKGTVRIHMLIFPFAQFPKLSKAELKAKVEEVRAKILSGVPLQAAAPKQFKDLGYIHREDLREDLLPLVKDYSYGEVGEVGRLKDAYVLFEIAGAVDEQGRPDENFRARVKKVIFSKKYEKEVARFLKEELPKRHHIETKF